MNTADFSCVSVAEASVADRTTFIHRTYLHVVGALIAFVAIESLLFQTGVAQKMAAIFFSYGSWVWLVILGVYMIVGLIADRMAYSMVSIGMQYAGLGLFVLIEALIFAPLLVVATAVGGAELLTTAAGLTLLLTVALTLLAFRGGVNWTFLSPFLAIGGIIALGTIVASIVFGFTLGVWFSGAMIFFMSGAILYNTSAVMHQYSTMQHVAAALSLFVSITTLFWHVLQLLMSLGDFLTILDD